MTGGGKLALVGHRVLHAVPALIGIIIVTFLLTRALPGDPAIYFAGPTADAETIAQVRHALGFDRSLPVQFLVYLQPAGARRPRAGHLDGPERQPRTHRPPSGLARTDIDGAGGRHRRRRAARHPRGDAARQLDRPSLPLRRDARRFAPHLLHRPRTGVRLLLPAGLGPGADGAARHSLFGADGDHRLLHGRRAAHRRLGNLPRRAGAAAAAGGDARAVHPGADRPDDAGIHAPGAGVRLHPHRARRRPVAPARAHHLRLRQCRAAGHHHARHGVLLRARRQRARRARLRLARHRLVRRRRARQFGLCGGAGVRAADGRALRRP